MYQPVEKIQGRHFGTLRQAPVSPIGSGMRARMVACADDDGPMTFASTPQCDLLIIAFGEVQVSILSNPMASGECLLILDGCRFDEVVVSGSFMMIEMLGSDEFELVAPFADTQSKESVLRQKSPCLHLLAITAKRHLSLDDIDISEYAHALAVVARAEFASQCQSPDSGFASELPHWKMQLVEAYILENIEDTILLDELADRCQMSPGHFSRLFKARTGSTPHQYILAKRIAVACNMLTQASLPICQIALSTGFSSQSHMTAIFKKTIGLTPKCYRDEHLSFPAMPASVVPQPVIPNLS